MSDDRFEPRLGRVRSRGNKRARRYLSRIVATLAKGNSPQRARSRRFDGSRIGRGASIGRLLKSRQAGSRSGQRRVIVKTSLVRLAGRQASAAAAHMRYLQRDGVTREGAPGELYSARDDRADGTAFLRRSQSDRHQFRFIVSAEDSDQYRDLKPLVRRLMTQMETDLGTGLEWVAVDHFNTGHPHSHILLRGVDDGGKNLVIAREYIAHGLRQRAAELVTLDLGPSAERERLIRRQRELTAERLTETDRALLRSMDAARVVASLRRDPVQQALIAGRLQALEQFGLAEPIGRAHWRLSEEMEPSLRMMSERGDIVRTMQRELASRKLDRPWHAAPQSDQHGQALLGRVIARGLSDEVRDRHYLIIDAVDGRAHYVDIGRGDGVEPLAEGAIVRLKFRTAEARPADRTVAEVAAAFGGRYSVEAHLRHDPRATEAYAAAHVRRLEAMRQSTGSVDRLSDGSWSIGTNHLENAAAYEAKLARDCPVEIETMSASPLEQLLEAHAATFLDRELLNPTSEPLRDAGFGQEMRRATARRLQWLDAHGLATITDGTVTLVPNLIQTLERSELAQASKMLSEELGLEFSEVSPAQVVTGKLARRIDLLSGRFALITNERSFALVPWRPVLAKQLGKDVSGRVRPGGIDWQFGRTRSGPEIG